LELVDFRPVLYKDKNAMDGMVTDKGFFDAVWCPVTLLDTTNDHNRMKPNRDYDPLEGIHQALSLGQRTRWVNIKNHSPLTREATPHRQSFWLHVPFREGKLLLTVHRFFLDPITSGEGILTITRDRRYDPRDEETYRAEIHLQVLILKHVETFFPRVKQVKIISRYPTWKKQEMTCPTEEQVLGAQEFACYINDLCHGNIKLLPRLEKCHVCWWRECREHPHTKSMNAPILFNDEG
jgi:hypothetical protein